MNFWNFIGLPSKSDVVNINKNLENIEFLLSSNVKTIIDSTSKINSQKFSEIEKCINSLSEKVNHEVNNLNDNDDKNRKIMNSILKQMDSYFLKLSVESKKHLKDMRDCIEKIKMEILHINNLIEKNKELKSLEKELSIIEQMMRVIWVNDILDTLENRESKLKKR